MSSSLCRLRSLSGTNYSPASSNGRDKLQRGFSLIELMMGLVLVAILLGIGVPLFQSFILEQRLRATSSDLRIALTTARSEAIKRNRVVEVIPNADGWGDGWTIPGPDGGVTILSHKQTGEVTINGPDEATFTPSGRAVAAAEFEIEVGPESSEVLACLQLALDGRMNSMKGACP